MILAQISPGLEMTLAVVSIVGAVASIFAFAKAYFILPEKVKELEAELAAEKTARTNDHDELVKMKAIVGANSEDHDTITKMSVNVETILKDVASIKKVVFPAAAKKHGKGEHAD